jgi:hypothetical protein
MHVLDGFALPLIQGDGHNWPVEKLANRPL